MNVLDAKFPTFDDGPVKLLAHDQEDLDVVSALLQDAVFLYSDIKHYSGNRELVILCNRFRWESSNINDENSMERVRSLLIVKDVLNLFADIGSPSEESMPYSLLLIDYESGIDGTGRINLKLSGHWDIAIDVECINVSLTDVTMPYSAPSRKAPRHIL